MTKLKNKWNSVLKNHCILLGKLLDCETNMEI